MTNLNQIDLNIRLQLAGCKYSELANTFASRLKYGMKSTCNLRNLTLLNYLIEILECYTIESTKSQGTINIERVNAGDIVDILINNISVIGGPRTLTIVTANLLPTIVTDYINNNTSYIATLDKTGLINVEGDCKNGLITYYLSSAEEGSIIEVSGLTGGQCDNNCIKQEQIQLLIDQISKLVGLCFQPIGFEYDIPEGYTLNEDGCLIPN